jgi:D-sedoheptulose 7-phosphate isomerase
MSLDFAKQFFQEVSDISQRIDVERIDAMANALAQLREQGGRLFLLGVGGSAGNCSHAVNDFRKICGIETYTPVDNVSELTARTNDEGWDTIFSAWLKTSRINSKDAILVFSVGGGDLEKGISTNIISAVDLAKSVGASVYAILGKDTGYTAKHGDIVVVVPPVENKRITPHSEAFQGVVWHCLVSHPSLQITATKWESVTNVSNLEFSPKKTKKSAEVEVV